MYHAGSSQNYGPFWGTLNNRCRIMIRIQKGTLILTTTHVEFRSSGSEFTVAGWITHQIRNIPQVTVRSQI